VRIILFAVWIDGCMELDEDEKFENLAGCLKCENKFKR